MDARQVDIDGVVLGDPGATVWTGFAARKVALIAAPVALQPSPYIQAKWRDGTFGQVSALGAQLLHNGAEVAVRIEWACPQASTRRFDNRDFADGAALLFPLTEHAPLFMGAEQAPVNIWHWRADRPDAARSNVAVGIGTSRVLEQGSIATQALYRDGHWAVVFRRALSVTGQAEAVQFRVGEATRMAFCIWNGSNAERGGLKSFSPTWLDVTLAGRGAADRP